MPPVNPPVSKKTIQATSRSNNTFDFDQFNKSLAEQNAAREARQAEEVRVAQEQSRIQQQSATLAQQQFDSMKFLRDDVMTSQAKARDARRLADSNNPLDTLELMGKQLMDPNGYLREQREKRLQEDAQQAGILQTYFATGQDNLRQQLLSSTSTLNVLKTIEAVGAEKLTAYSDNAKLMHGQIMAIQSMKDDAISGLSDQQIAAAVSQAKLNPDGKVNIGGVDIDQRTLEDRQSALQERQYNNLTRQVALSLKTDEASHLDETLADREAARAVAKDDRGHLGQTLALRNAERNQQAQTLIDEANKRYLRTLSKSELNDLRVSKYKDQTSGIQYNPDDVEAVYQNRLQTEVNQANEAVTQFQMDNFDTGILASESDRITGIMGRFKSSAPLYQAATKYQSALNLAAHGSGSGQGPITRMATMQIYQDSRKNFDAAIEKQAKFDASNGGRGQLDSNLESMRIAYYRGEPVPQENLINAATDRLIKFKSLNDLFPPELATSIERHYRDIYQNRIKQDSSTPFTTMSAEDRKIVQADAAQEAIQWGVNQTLQGQTDRILANQVKDSNHPLANMSPAQFGSYLAAGDSKGKAIWQQLNGLSDDDANTIAGGLTPKGKTDQEAASLKSQLDFYQTQQFLQTVDSISPGTASQVTDWWQQHGADYIDRVSGSITGSADGSFQSGNFASTANKIIADQFGKYAILLGQADTSYQQELVNRNADLVTFSSNPESAQVAILSNDKNLSDPERTQIFQEVIRPLLKTAADKGMDFQTTNRFIEQQLQSYQPQTPEMKSLMKTLRRDRTNVLESMNTWSRSIRDLFTVTSPNVAASVDSGELISPETRWYKEWRTNNKIDSVRTPYKPSISLGPLQIGGDRTAYEQRQRSRSQ